MVENTLGQLWTEINPDTKITSDLEFYIKPAYKEQLKERERKSIEDVKFFEPCAGSGHILSYAFDIFYKIYEEEGYSSSEIPELIITKNLFGTDIDERAAQLASFVLIMKGREKHRRFLRTVEKKHIKPNITFYQDFLDDSKFNNGSVLGALVKVEPFEINQIEVDEKSLFGERDAELKKLYQFLGQRYDVVVTNPPYISSSRMEGSLKKYVEANYPETKSDLFATFVLRCLELCNDDGLTGYMTPFVWMFISSYEKLRKTVVDKHFINNLIQLEYSGFDGATVPICTFTLRNRFMNAKGSYIRLSDFKGAKVQAPKTIEAIQNPDCGWFYTANQKDFEKIPGSPIGYWLSEKMISLFSANKKLSEVAKPRQGMATTNNNIFLRFWREVKHCDIGFSYSSENEALNSGLKWFPYNKGGEKRKWYGNQEYVVNWTNNGKIISDYIDDSKTSKVGSNGRIINREYYFCESISWSDITSSGNSFRYYPKGFIFDISGMSLFIKNNTMQLLGTLNTNFISILTKLINPSLHLQVGDVSKLPFLELPRLQSGNIVKTNISISKQEWNSRETSWDFTNSELLIVNDELAGENGDEPNNSQFIIKHSQLENAYNDYCSRWSKRFLLLHKNEEELNRQFIEIYGLQDELDEFVPFKEITILKDEIDQKKLKVISDQWAEANRKEVASDQWLGAREKELVANLKDAFNKKEIMAQFISYAVGCMFGRYSLDKPGLILANAGEGVEDFVRIIDNYKLLIMNENQDKDKDNSELDSVEESNSQLKIKNSQFTIDSDNIIPVLDDEWFEDDIVTRFKEFLKAAFGKENYNQNLTFM